LKKGIEKNKSYLHDNQKEYQDGIKLGRRGGNSNVTMKSGVNLREYIDSDKLPSQAGSR